MEILTSEQMRRVDRRAIETLGISSLLLMESAGRGVAQALIVDYPHEVAAGVLVLCGKGNNGGDGLVVARHLARARRAPRVVLLASGDELAGDAAVNLRAARASGVDIVEARDEVRWADERGRLPRYPLVLDAMLGTGIRGGARGLVRRVIEDLERTRTRVIALDVPSGLDGDSTRVEGAAVRAERTYTLCRPKLALVLGEASARSGTWSVIPIGVPDEAVRAEAPTLDWLDAREAAALLAPRAAASHKGNYGHLLAVAGSRGKAGAAGLLARAALRSGVGLVTVATPSGLLPTVASYAPEVMTEPLPETAEGALARAAVDPVADLAGARDALAIGPGLGTSDETRAAVLEILARRACPAIVDADALNVLALADPSERGRVIGAGKPWVLTPHPGEAARLLRTEVREVQADRLEAARELARQADAVVVLKGHRTLVAHPDGRVSVNSTGNPGMATAGTGDVLAGIVGSLLARGMAPLDAARLAVFAHGNAGDRAAARRGEEGLVAGDLLECLPRALARLARPIPPRAW